MAIGNLRVPSEQVRVQNSGLGPSSSPSTPSLLTLELVGQTHIAPRLNEALTPLSKRTYIDIIKARHLQSVPTRSLTIGVLLTTSSGNYKA